MIAIKHYEEWEERSTPYKILIIDMDKGSLETRRLGGQFLTAVLIGKHGEIYPLNKGYKHPSYIKEKYKFLSVTDAEIVARKLNNLFNNE